MGLIAQQMELTGANYMRHLHPHPTPRDTYCQNPENSGVIHSVKLPIYDIDPTLLPITSANVDRYSKFFHRQTQQ